MHPGVEPQLCSRQSLGHRLHSADHALPLAITHVHVFCTVLDANGNRVVPTDTQLSVFMFAMDTVHRV